MADERIRVGLVGCGGISSLYTSIYAGLVDIAQVVAVADLVDELAEHRRQVLTDAYAAEAHTARVAAAEARVAATRETQQRRADVAAAAAATPIRKYHSHEELLQDEEVQAMVLLTAPSVRGEPTIAAAEAGRHIFTQGRWPAAWRRPTRWWLPFARPA